MNKFQNLVIRESFRKEFTSLSNFQNLGHKTRSFLTLNVKYSERTRRPCQDILKTLNFKFV